VAVARGGALEGADRALEVAALVQAQARRIVRARRPGDFVRRHRHRKHQQEQEEQVTHRALAGEIGQPAVGWRRRSVVPQDATIATREPGRAAERRLDLQAASAGLNGS
jgi:hypothetical protein